MSKEFDVAKGLVEYMKKSNLLQKEDMETLYGLYKQATCGNCNIKEPNKLNIVAYLKYKNWMKNKGKSKDVAMSEYSKFTETVASKYLNNSKK